MGEGEVNIKDLILDSAEVSRSMREGAPGGRLNLANAIAGGERR